LVGAATIDEEDAQKKMLDAARQGSLALAAASPLSVHNALFPFSPLLSESLFISNSESAHVRYCILHRRGYVQKHCT